MFLTSMFPWPESMVVTIKTADLNPNVDTVFSKIVASYDLATDLSAVLDSGGAITQGFCGPFILNSSYHDFEKLTKDEK